MFPNAIGIQLTDAKHVFGSFLSRETAYQLMIGMTKKQLQVPLAIEQVESKEDDEIEPQGLELLEVTESSKEDSSSLSSDCAVFKIAETSLQEPIESIQEQPIQQPPKVPHLYEFDIKAQPKLIAEVPRSNQSMVLFIGIALTLALAFFSAFLLVRINSLENRHLTTRDYSRMSIEEAEQVLDRNLVTVRNVRQKLEELRSHLESKFKEQARDEL